MRFTKIPLIATLMAVALSLLIVLPTIAQTSDITDGRGGDRSGLSVGVFDDINDAQLAKLRPTTFTDWPGTAPVPPPHIPIEAGTDPTNIGAGVNGVHDDGDPAFLADRRVDPQDTFFRNTLYVSNNVGAFNTVLVNVAHDPALTGNNADGRNCVQNNPNTQDVNERLVGTANVTASVRNNRSGQSITMEMVVAAGGANSQAFFKVVEQGDTVTIGTGDEAREVPFTQHGGPTWCENDKTRDYDATPDDDTDEPTPVEVETQATAAQYNPTGFAATGGDRPPVVQEIATLLARHGDRITITVSGQSGSVELTVDGDGPDFTAITPEDNDVTRPSRLTYSFEVRDDDSGLRHDGESVISNDGDYEEINPDGDPHLETEPLSVDTEAQVAANGPAADIDVNIATNPMNGTPPNDERDISASGTWSIAGSRAGVAYAFTASGADKSDGSYLYQLRARDRAGNWSETDGDDDRLAPGDQPFVFRVDDTDPDLVEARTGISYDTEKNEEEVDRSYIALTFNSFGVGGADALGDVNTDNITVVGHNVVGYIHPSRAPAINRNQAAPTRDEFPPTAVSYSAAEPATTRPSSSEVSAARNADPRTAEQNATLLLQGRWEQYTADSADTTVAPTPPATAEPSATECASTADTDDDNIELCGRWTQYKIDDALYDSAVEAEEKAETAWEEALAAFNKAANPGTDIRDETITEPRATVYIELAEDLASDATPTVQVVGGAVYDLAGNTNGAETLNEADDWIAPKLTVTVTGTAPDRQVANAKSGSFTVDVTADEDVSRPTLYFVSLSAALNEDEDGYDYTIGALDQAGSLTAQEDENHWNRKYKVSSGDLSVFDDGLVGVIVVTDDDEDNSGATAGWSPRSHRDAVAPTAGKKLDPGKMDDADLLIEIDRLVEEAGKVFVTPRSDSDGEETESSNPFVKLDFSSEGREYEVCPAGTAEAPFKCGGEGEDANPAAEYKDSHSRVEVVEITVNGDDAYANLARIDSNEFSLVMRDLEVGEYKVWYAVADDAGNESDEGNFTFDVLPRQPYEIDVTPGWNLISLPATPLEPAIGSVLANNPYISPVLGYQQGDWVTAIQEEDGTWRGRLTEITGGYGYWIHARTFETIETMLAETDPASTLPTVSVTQGWNLLGVLDVHQNDQGQAPGETTKDESGDETVGSGEADEYLSSIPWRVAYTYDTTASLWVKTVPKDASDDEIVNGNGYWVWSNTPSTLAP